VYQIVSSLDKIYYSFNLSYNQHYSDGLDFTSNGITNGSWDSWYMVLHGHIIIKLETNVIIF